MNVLYKLFRVFEKLIFAPVMSEAQESSRRVYDNNSLPARRGNRQNIPTGGFCDMHY